MRREYETDGYKRVELVARGGEIIRRHPVRRDTGFNIGYSHRGHGEYPNLESEAQAFFDGIQVPGQ